MIDNSCCEIIADIDKDNDIKMNIEDNDVIIDMDSQIGYYPLLLNKPKINEVTLIGNKTSEELHLQHKMNEITNQEIDEIIFG